MISVNDVVRMLGECGFLAEDAAPDEEFVLDSMTLVWLVHLLQEEHGITVRPDDEEDLASCASAAELHRLLTRTTAKEVVHDA
ncbi:hypothetical protein ABZ307_42225 [Streptomyces griseorubiginosus]|uniref:hypothetical protein n=1 Tax=Streptomyces griseorubiginosus TaxID=67304 RepID=UPI0033B7B9FD